MTTTGVVIKLQLRAVMDVSVQTIQEISMTSRLSAIPNPRQKRRIEIIHILTPDCK